MDLLCGAYFKGQLSPQDGESCVLTYRFNDDPMPPPLPMAVKRQRQTMKLPWREGISCVAAFCSIPSLGLENEEVVVSVEQPATDGAHRMLVQSLQRPELGITVLRLESGGSQLSGGDEDWTPGEPPIIRASRATPTSPKAASPSSKKTGGPKPARPVQASRLSGSRRSAASENEQCEQRDADPTSAAAKAIAAPSRKGSPARKLYPDPFSDYSEVDVEEEERRAVIAASVALPKTPIEGGIGRLGMHHSAQSAVTRQHAPGDPALPRPDVAASMPQQPSALLDEQLRAAEAEAVERLVAAAANGETGDMKLLLARIGSDHLGPPGSRHEGLTPLMAAAGRGRDDALALLIEKRADLETTDLRGWTALMHAVSDQRPAAVRSLLEARASTSVASAMDEGVTPLMLAATGARAELCVVLLQARASTTAVGSDGRRAIHYAARAGRNGALMTLLEARAAVDDADESGLTPLLTAASAGRAESVKVLLGARANAMAEDTSGRSAADIAGAFEVPRVISALREHATARASERQGRRQRAM